MNELRKIAENYMRSELVRLEGKMISDSTARKCFCGGQNRLYMLEVQPDCRNDRVEK